jgi:hypothetical protein
MAARARTTIGDRATSLPARTTADGVVGNARLTAAVAAALLVLLAAEGATIPFIGQLLGPHVFIGMLLLGPVALKLASTGYRFSRYYGREPRYVRRGPPPLPLRLLAPGVVLTTLALFGTGVALLIQGPPSGTLGFAHKLSFIAWVALMSLHVIGHLVEVVPPLGDLLPPAVAARLREGSVEGAPSGGRLRAAALVAALLVGVGLGFVGLAARGAWF